MADQESTQQVDAESDETTLHEQKDQQKDQQVDGGGSDPTDYQPSSDLPEPAVEPPAPPPGGPDAIVGVGGAAGNGPSLPADPDPERNPATDDELPSEVEAGEDTDTKATKETPDESPGTGAGVEPEQESPA